LNKRITLPNFTMLSYSNFFYCKINRLRNVHSFPTRRSSDLIGDVDKIANENRWEANGVSFRHSGNPKPFSQFCHISISSKGFRLDRKSTRLNSSHVAISYAVFCLKKKYHIHHELVHSKN